MGTHVAADAAPRRAKKVAPRRGERQAARPVRQAVVDDVELSVGDGALFSELKALRGRIARDEKVPAYVVFPDRTLAEMAVKRPASLTALEEVRGVGPARRDKYGEQFLTLIRGADGPEAA